MFANIDRGTMPYREPPARRLGVILSSLFLLSLGAVATATTMRAGNGQQIESRIAIGSPASTATR